MIETFVINGFLESGKTDFIKYTIAQPYFRLRGKTLVIVCEEGESEYEQTLLQKHNVVVEIIDREMDFNDTKLTELEKKHSPKRIIIEFNGMWNHKTMKLPNTWNMEQQITMFDANTFKNYYDNMKSIILEMSRKSELIIFNRCDEVEDLTTFKRNLKIVNTQADIVFEGANGEIPTILEEELPYNLDASTLKLDDDNFGVWYMDMYENTERYIGKKVEFEGEVLLDSEMQEGYFIPGRLVMTCCADDMEFLGFPCAYDKMEQIKDKSWVKVKAVVAKEYFEDYQGEGPILHGLSVLEVNEPKDRILNFK